MVTVQCNEKLNLKIKRSSAAAAPSSANVYLLFNFRRIRQFIIFKNSCSTFNKEYRGKSTNIPSVNFYLPTNQDLIIVHNDLSKGMNELVYKKHIAFILILLCFEQIQISIMSEPPKQELIIKFFIFLFSGQL